MKYLPVLLSDLLFCKYINLFEYDLRKFVENNKNNENEICIVLRELVVDFFKLFFITIRNRYINCPKNNWQSRIPSTQNYTSCDCPFFLID